MIGWLELVKEGLASVCGSVLCIHTPELSADDWIRIYAMDKADER